MSENLQSLQQLPVRVVPIVEQGKARKPVPGGDVNVGNALPGAATLRTSFRGCLFAGGGTVTGGAPFFQEATVQRVTEHRWP